VPQNIFDRSHDVNIHAPVMMLAEKVADLILGNSPLPPEDTEFYRSGLE
jgi:choline dehydrogenase